MYTSSTFSVDPSYAGGRYHAHFVVDEDRNTEEGITPDSPEFYTALAIEIRADESMDSSALSEHYLERAAHLIVFLPSPETRRLAFTKGESYKDHGENEFGYSRGIVYDSNQTPLESIAAFIPSDFGLYLKDNKPDEIMVVALDDDQKVIAMDTLSYGMLDGTRVSAFRKAS